MFRFNHIDAAGGALLVLIGASVSYISITSYPLGTVQRMGPGAFPAGLGVVLALLGLILAAQSLRGSYVKPDIRVYSPLFVLGSIAAFALTIGSFGLVPAIVATIVVASLADLRVRPVSLALLCLGLSLLAPFVFVVCLGLQIRMLNWPF